MTRKEAIEILRHLQINIGRQPGKHLIQEAMNMAIEALEQTQWIPCSERLPEKPKPNDEFEGKPLDIYLVCRKGNIPFRAFWNGKNFTDGWTSLDVGAWMPLPNPWKGKEDD